MTDPSNPSKVDRRGFLTAAGVGAGVVAVGAVGARVARKRPPARPGPPDAQVAALFGDRAAGGEIGGCRIERVYGVYLGAIPVVLRCAGGTRFQVDILRRDPGGPTGIGNTDRFSLYLANQGDGRVPTRESQGVAVLQLAALLGDGAPPDGLLTLAERQARHAGACFAVAPRV